MNALPRQHTAALFWFWVFPSRVVPGDKVPFRTTSAITVVAGLGIPRTPLTPPPLRAGERTLSRQVRPATGPWHQDSLN